MHIFSGVCEFRGDCFLFLLFSAWPSCPVTVRLFSPAFLWFFSPELGPSLLPFKVPSHPHPVSLSLLCFFAHLPGKLLPLLPSWSSGWSQLQQLLLAPPPATKEGRSELPECHHSSLPCWHWCCSFLPFMAVTNPLFFEATLSQLFRKTLEPISSSHFLQVSDQGNGGSLYQSWLSLGGFRVRVRALSWLD